MAADPDIIAAAAGYAARGWSVIPVGEDKRPAVRGWKSRQKFAASADEARAWFSRISSVKGVGIVLGGVSGNLYVRDFDDASTYERWRNTHPEIAARQPTVRTSRGFHVYGRWAGIKTRHVLGGELRGEGAYVVAPPSPHPSGSFYEWVIPLTPDPVPELDPDAAGLAEPKLNPDRGSRVTERTEKTETTESTENPETAEETEDAEDTDAIWGGPELRSRISQAIQRTVPGQFARRNYQIFKLARALMGFPEFAEIPVSDVRKLRPIVKEWHRLSLPHILTKDFGTTWGDFVHAWPRVRHPEGSDAVKTALAAAESSAPPPWASDYSSECRLLASLCRELQRRAGDAPFFLSAETAGRAVGKDKMTASRWLKAFVGDRALEVVVPGNAQSRKATRYRYLGKDLQ